jgi:uncharacterized membrane protein
MSGLGTLVGFILPHAIVLAMGTAPGDIVDYIRFYAGRPPEVESLQGNLLALGHFIGLISVRPGFDFGSVNVIASNWQALARVISFAFGAIYFATLLFMLRVKDRRRAETFAMGFIVITLILSSKVFSGEYLIWMLPFALLAVGFGRWNVVIAYAIALIFLKITYWNWDSVTAIQPLGTTLIALKNFACIGMAYLFAKEFFFATRPCRCTI